MTTNASGNNPVRSRKRRATAGLLSTGLVAAGLTALGVAGAAPASAAPISVSNAAFTWDINNEVNAGAFAPGTWNLMSAGKIGNPGAGGASLRSADNGATWNNDAAAGWKNTAGNVTIEDKQADGSYAPTTFLGTRQNSAGTNTSGGSNSILAETRMVVKNGVGTLDADADNASISWTGDATVLFYSGMTYFTLSNPKLTLANGAGTVTATVGGYATSMDDPTKWEAVPDQTLTIASLTGVDVTPTGLTATPAYREVAYTAPSTSSPQVATGANWGSFPQGFVDFQQVLGQGPYWYSTGGVADPRKIANPLSVAYSEFPQAQVSVADTTLLPNGSYEVAVTGSGFDPTRAPAPGYIPGMGSGGAYVAFGKYAEVWRPSAGAPAANRKNLQARWAVLAADIEKVGGAASGAIELTPAGTFSTTLTIDKSAIDAAATAEDLVNYGVYTYRGGTGNVPTFETFTPITFAKATPTVSLTASNVTFGQASTAAVAVTSEGGTTGTVTLKRGETPVGTATLVDGKATFALGKLGAGRYPLTASYSGNENTDAAEAVTAVTVAKAASTTRVKLAPKPRRKKAGKAAVTVTSPSGPVAGSAQVVVRTAKGKAVTKVRKVTIRNGKAALKLGRLAKGRYKLVVRFPATANLTASTRTITFRVA